MLCDKEGALALLPGMVAVLQQPAFLLLWPALHDRSPAPPIHSCPADQPGASACATANVTVTPAAPATAAAIEAFGSTLTTAAAAGSSGGLCAAVRSLASAAANVSPEALTQAATQAGAAVRARARSSGPHPCAVSSGFAVSQAL